NLAGDGLPHLAGPELGVEEALDEAGLGILLRYVAASLFHERVFKRLEDGEAFDALCAPVGGDLVARHAPDLLGIRLEEGVVEFAAEPVDDEILEVALGGDGARRRAEVAEARASQADQAHLSDG